eukprot:gene3806-2692_t
MEASVCLYGRLRVSLHGETRRTFWGGVDVNPTGCRIFRCIVSDRLGGGSNIKVKLREKRMKVGHRPPHVPSFSSSDSSLLIKLTHNCIFPCSAVLHLYQKTPTHHPSPPSYLICHYKRKMASVTESASENSSMAPPMIPATRIIRAHSPAPASPHGGAAIHRHPPPQHNGEVRSRSLTAVYESPGSFHSEGMPPPYPSNQYHLGGGTQVPPFPLHGLSMTSEPDEAQENQHQDDTYPSSFPLDQRPSWAGYQRRPADSMAASSTLSMSQYAYEYAFITPRMRVPPRQARVMAGGDAGPVSRFRQFTAGVTMGVQRRRRHWITLGVEILLPILFVVAVVWLQVHFTKRPAKEDTEPIQYTNVYALPNWYQAWLCYNSSSTGSTIPTIRQCHPSYETIECSFSPALPFPPGTLCVVVKNSEGDLMSWEWMVAGFLGYTMGSPIPVRNLDYIIAGQWVGEGNRYKEELMAKQKAASEQTPEEQEEAAKSDLVSGLMSLVSALGSSGASPQYTRLDSLLSSGMLYFAPAALVPEELITYLKQTSAFFGYVYGGTFDTMEAVEAHILRKNEDLPLYKRRHWGIVEIFDIKDSFNVQLHFNGTALPAFEAAQNIDFDGFYYYNSADMYLAAGFIHLQKVLYDYYIHSQKESGRIRSGYDPITANLPFTTSVITPSEAREYQLLAYARPLVAFVLVLAFVYPFMQMVKNVVTDRELRIREATSIMGLRRAPLYCCYFFLNALQGTITVTLFAIAIRYGLMRNSSFSLIWLIFLVYYMTLIPLAALVGACFSSARFATQMAPIVYFLIVIPPFIMSSSPLWLKYTLSALFSPAAVSEMLQTVLLFVSGSGFHNNAMSSPFVTGVLPSRLFLLLTGDILRVALPDLVPLSENAREKLYSVPKASCRGMPAALRVLETRGAALGVRGFSVSATTLEEVFLAVVERAAKGQDIESGGYEASEPQLGQQAKIQGSADGDWWQLTPSPSDTKSRTKLLLRRFQAVLRERCLLAKRDRRFQVLQILCPLVCALLAVSLVLVHFSPPSLSSGVVTYDLSTFEISSQATIAECNALLGSAVEWMQALDKEAQASLDTSSMSWTASMPSPLLVDVASTVVSTVGLVKQMVSRWYSTSRPQYMGFMCHDPEFTDMVRSHQLGSERLPSTITGLGVVYNTSSTPSLPIALHTLYKQIVRHGFEGQHLPTFRLTSKPMPWVGEKKNETGMLAPQARRIPARVMAVLRRCCQTQKENKQQEKGSLCERQELEEGERQGITSRSTRTNTSDSTAISNIEEVKSDRPHLMNASHDPFVSVHVGVEGAQSWREGWGGASCNAQVHVSWNSASPGVSLAASRFRQSQAHPAGSPSVSISFQVESPTETEAVVSTPLLPRTLGYSTLRLTSMRQSIVNSFAVRASMFMSNNRNGHDAPQSRAMQRRAPYVLPGGKFYDPCLHPGLHEPCMEEEDGGSITSSCTAGSAGCPFAVTRLEDEDSDVEDERIAVHQDAALKRRYPVQLVDCTSALFIILSVIDYGCFCTSALFIILSVIDYVRMRCFFLGFELGYVLNLLGGMFRYLLTLCFDAQKKMYDSVAGPSCFPSLMFVLRLEWSVL